jgi:hypothetical protein
MPTDDDIKTLAKIKDTEITDLKKEMDLLNGALLRANKKMLALRNEIEELQKTGDIKQSLKEYEEL